MTVQGNRKRDKFVELAEKRVNRAIRDIRLIANLANRGSYTYTDEEVRQIFRALDAELKAARARFDNTDHGGEKVFRLKR